MIFFNVLSHKYTDEKVKEALKPWVNSSNNEPQKYSIKSRLINNSTTKETNIVIYRKYPIFYTFTFPSHYYMSIDEKIWHPGYGDDMNIFQKETTSVVGSDRYSIIEIMEKCNYCVYWELYRNFQSDKHFNIMTNNCQVIMGMFAETVCLVIIFTSIIAAAITGYLMFLLIAFFFLLVIVLFTFSTYCTDRYKYSTCIHVIPIRKY